VRVESHLAEVLEDDGDVHVDDDEEADDEIGDQVDNDHVAGTAVAEWLRLGRRVVASQIAPSTHTHGKIIRRVTDILWRVFFYFYVTSSYIRLYRKSTK